MGMLLLQMALMQHAAVVPKALLLFTPQGLWHACYRAGLTCMVVPCVVISTSFLPSPLRSACIHITLLCSVATAYRFAMQLGL